MNKADVKARCVRFLRHTADILENDANLAGANDPVGVLMFTDEGPILFVPDEYVHATETILEQSIELRGYGEAREAQPH